MRVIFADAYQDGQIDRNPLDRIKNFPLLIGLEWGDVDFEKGFVSVRGGILRRHVKGNKNEIGTSRYYSPVRKFLEPVQKPQLRP